MADKGRNYERHVAGLFSGRRVGCTGQATADVEIPWAEVMVECKERRSVTWGLLVDALDSIRVKAHRRAWTGVVCARKKLGRGIPGQDLVVIEAADFKALLDAVVNARAEE